MNDDSELIDRVRRIETKVTKLGEQAGVDMGGQKPCYTGSKIEVPTPHVSLASVIAAIPKDVVTTVPVVIGSRRVGYVARP